MIRTIIVDDHQLFIEGVKMLIAKMEDIEVVGEASNGVDLIDVLSSTEADVVLLDINMPQMDGVEATKHLVDKHPHVKVLMLTMHDTRNHIEKLLKTGAHGYVLKNTGGEELEKAIRTVHGGQSFYSETVTKRIMEGLQQRKNVEREHGHVQLTQREQDVLKLIANEFTTAEIGEQLFISPHTVESHRKNLMSKLGVRNSIGLVKYAVQMGLVD
ncbi:MAG: response regulator transcription factor [Bacteroidia bacterium]|nr:response regulator transcription factor [Bacteroidia bacterium]